jgi:hypothetical protein
VDKSAARNTSVPTHGSATSLSIYANKGKGKGQKTEEHRIRIQENDQKYIKA